VIVGVRWSGVIAIMTRRGTGSPAAGLAYILTVAWRDQVLGTHVSPEVEWVTM
jgi:hypothetical protein